MHRSKKRFPRTAIPKVWLFITWMFLLLSTFSLAQTSTYTSAANGTWGTAGTWTCTGTCATTTPSSSTNDAVVINHVVTFSTGSRLAYSVRIENSIASQDAKLTISGTGTLTVGTGGLIINGTTNTGGNTEFSVTGSGTTTINGNTTLTQNKNSGTFTKFRVGGGGAASSATVIINGNLALSYLNSSTTTPETQHEVSMGSTAGDAVTLTVNGNTSLTYNFNDTGTANNVLAINAANSSIINFYGDVTMTMTEGGTHGIARLSLEDDATVTVTGTTTLNYNDDNAGTELTLEVGTPTNPTNTAELLLVNLNLSSATSTNTINNYIKTYDEGLLSVSGDITLSHSGSGSTPSVENRIEANGNSTIEVGGTIINETSGAFEYVGTGTTALFSGISAQIIPNNLRSGTTYQNIEINNAAGVSFGSTTIIPGTVTLSNGILTSTLTNLLILTDNATTAGGSSSSYISGPVRKTCATGTCSNTSFHVGDATSWAPIDINNITGEDATTTFTIEYLQTGYSTTTTDGTFDHISGFEYWSVDVTGTVPTVDLVFHWKDACASQIEDVTSGGAQTLFIGHYNTALSQWEKLAATIDGGSQDCIAGGGAETGYITAASVSSFSPFTFIAQTANDNPLPVELVQFEVSTNPLNKIEIRWQTAAETECDYFQIERAQNMNNWQVIDKVTGQGTTQHETIYLSIDNQPNAGKNYYRLKQYDFDGSYRYSPVKMIDFTGDNEFYLNVYPNPIDPKTFELTLESNHLLHNPVISLLSMCGALKKEIIIDGIQDKFKLNLTDLADGLYLLTVTSREGTVKKNILVQKK